MHLFSIQKRPKKPPRRPTALPKRFKTRSRRPQDAPRRAQAAPQTPQDAPKTPQDRPKRRAKRPKTPQDAGTKRVPKAIRSAIPSRPRFWSVLGWILGSFWMDFGSFWNSLWRLPQDDAKRAPDGSTTVEVGAKIDPKSPKRKNIEKNTGKIRFFGMSRFPLGAFWGCPQEARIQPRNPQEPSGN